MAVMKVNLLPKLQDYFDELEVHIISEDRKSVLQELIQYCENITSKNLSLVLNFVCTHNSRRSQISQIMAQTAAHLYGVDVICYSGGTEVTAFHPNAIAALQRTGMRVISKGDINPVHFVRFSKQHSPLSCFSKTYDDVYNEAKDFAAVMTCAHADDNCPVILNAVRIPVRYEDPKRSDGTDQMDDVYDATVKEIATEMKYVFQMIGNE